MSGGQIVLRVQDRFGRGPYRPGMSQRWRDYDNGADCPPWWEEIGEDMAAAHAALPQGLHIGCAFLFRSQLDDWFNVKEQRALDRLGYRLVAIKADRILYSTPTQVLVASKQPFTQVERTCRLCTVAARTLLADAA